MIVIRYCLSVNVIGFVYSALQIFDLGKYFVTKRHTIDPKLRGYLNFAMDQVKLIMSQFIFSFYTVLYINQYVVGFWSMLLRILQGKDNFLNQNQSFIFIIWISNNIKEKNVLIQQ